MLSSSTTLSWRTTIYGLTYHSRTHAKMLPMPQKSEFFNLYRHGFARLAVATPVVRVGDPQYNLDATVELMQEAAREKAVLAVFPELGLSAYTCDDLFHQQALIDGAEEALSILLRKARNLPLAALVG